MKQLLSLVEKRYNKKEWDIRVMVSKINQKCRDTNIIRVKKEPGRKLIQDSKNRIENIQTGR